MKFNDDGWLAAAEERREGPSWPANWPGQAREGRMSIPDCDEAY